MSNMVIPLDILGRGSCAVDIRLGDTQLLPNIDSIKINDPMLSFDMKLPCMWALLLDDDVNSLEYIPSFVERNLVVWANARNFMLKFLGKLDKDYQIEAPAGNNLVMASILVGQEKARIEIFDLISEGGRKPSYIQCPENGMGGVLGIRVSSEDKESTEIIAGKCIDILERNKSSMELAWTLLTEFRLKKFIG
jgi:hypothetical protein